MRRDKNDVSGSFNNTDFLTPIPFEGRSKLIRDHSELIKNIAEMVF